MRKSNASMKVARNQEDCLFGHLRIRKEELGEGVG